MAGKNKQAMKRHRQNLKRHEANQHFKSTVRSRIKKVLTAIEENDVNGAREAYKEAQSHLDKAARKKILHHRTASRKVKKLAKKINQLSASG